MALPDAARRHYLAQQALTSRTVAAARRGWAAIDVADLDGTWRAGLADRLFTTVAVGQLAAADQADPYVTAVLAEQGIDAIPDGRVVPRAFAGVASDGRSLDSLLYEPVIATKSAIGAGANPVDAARAGEASLTRIVMTQMQDAGRVPVGVATVARPRVGYVRMLNPPSCARCAVLAGAFYRSNTGFQRHPGCDCRHIPTAENVAGDMTTDPAAYFDSLTADDQARYFGAAGAQAIRDGADIGQVVNARSGMYQAGGSTFTRTAARRSTEGRRLMPESIYAQTSTREEAVELLERHGFLARR